MPKYDERNQSISVPVRIDGATVSGSTMTNAAAWIPGDTYIVEGLRYCVGAAGSTSAAVNIGKASVTGSTSIASATRLLTSDLNFRQETLVGSGTLVNSATLLTINPGDVLTVHCGGYFPPVSWGQLSITLRKV